MQISEWEVGHVFVGDKDGLILGRVHNFDEAVIVAVVVLATRAEFHEGFMADRIHHFILKAL